MQQTSVAQNVTPQAPAQNSGAVPSWAQS